MKTCRRRGRSLTGTKLAALAITCALSGALTSLIPASAAAAPQQDVEAAEQAYANMDYAEANKIADRLTKQGGLTREQLLRIYKILAVSSAVLDKDQQSKDAFIKLLTYDPDYEMDANTSPKVQSTFFEAKGFWRAQATKPGMEVATVLRPKEPGTIRVTLRDPTHIVRKLYIGYRWGSTGDMTMTPYPSQEATTVEVPAPPGGTTRLDYYAQAADEKDNVIFEFGNGLAPKSSVVQSDQVRVVNVGGKDGGSIFSSPVFWIIAGVAVAGGTTAILVATKKEVHDPGQPTGFNFLGGLVCGGGTPCR